MNYLDLRLKYSDGFESKPVRVPLVSEPESGVIALATEGITLEVDFGHGMPTSFSAYDGETEVFSACMSELVSDGFPYPGDFITLAHETRVTIYPEGKRQFYRDLGIPEVEQLARFICRDEGRDPDAQVADNGYDDAPVVPLWWKFQEKARTFLSCMKVYNSDDFPKG